MIDGTREIADHFAALAGAEGVCFVEPADANSNWLPSGYRLVTDPAHVLRETDCILPKLDTSWRLLSTVNSGARVGRKATDAGSDVRYVATKTL